MKKNIGLLSALVGIAGIGMLILSVILSFDVLTIIGIAMVLGSIVGGLVSAALEEDRDPTSWSARPDDGLHKPTSDKGQLPLGAYTSGHR